MTDRPASDPRELGRRSDWTGIAFGLCVALLAAYQQLKLPPVLPEMLDRFDYGPELAGGFMSVFAVIGLGLSLKIGLAMQRQSTAAWLVAGCVLVVVGAMPILAWPQSGWAVLAGRALEGLAMAILAVAGPTLMTRNAAPRHLPLAAALSATWIPLGGLVATLIGRAAESVLPAGSVWPSVWWGGVILAVGMALWTLYLARGDGRRLALPTAKGGAPDLPPSARRVLTLVALCFSFWALQNIAVLSWLPEYLVADRGLNHASAKEMYGLTVAAIAACNLFAAILLTSGLPIARLLAAVLAGQVVVLFLGPFAGTDWTGIAVLLAYGFFAGVTPTCLFALPGRILGPGGAGTAAFGMLMSGRNLGVLAGPIVVGWVGSSALGWSAGWWTAAMSTLCATAAALAIHRRIRAAGPKGDSPQAVRS